LTVPTNPAHDIEADPVGQPEYVNPVALKNRLIVLANAYTDVTQRLTGLITEVGEAKAQVETTKADLEDFESDLLVGSKPNTAQSKSNKTIQAFLRLTAEEAGIGPDYKKRQAAALKAVRELKRAEVKIEAARAVLNNIDMVSRNIQTHLSFAKHEYTNAQHFT
jgi:hypothetical protein